MKEQWEQECAALRAEVTTLQQQLQALAAQHASAKTPARWRVSKRMRLVVLPVIVFLAAGGVLYVEGAMEALFINEDGNVGIGNPTPQNLLHVGSGTSTIAKDRVNAVIASQTVDAGIAIAQKDNVNVLLQAAGAGGYIGTTSNHPLMLRTNNADRVSIDEDGKVGIGAEKPGAKLEVNGRIRDQTGYVMPVGSIVAYHGKTAPDGWLLCDGEAIPEEDRYKDLKTLLGKSTTPDLRGRTLIGVGQGTELTARPLGELGGEEKHTLTSAEMPKHNHHGFGESYDPYWPFGRVGPKGQKGSNGGVDQDNFYYNTSETGDSKPFNNMQPYYVVNYIIKY